MTQQDPGIDPAILEAFFSTATHEQLSKIPAYDAAVNRAISKTREETQQALQLQAQQQSALKDWTDYFDVLEEEDKTKPGVLQSALKDPNVRKHYDIVQNVRTQGHDPQLLRQAAAVEYTNALVAELKANPDFKD